MPSAKLATAQEQKYFGRPMRRIEDPKYLTGNASFLDDIRLDGMLHAVFVRSPQAHAKILRVDVSKALSQPGVVAVLTGKDLDGKVGSMPGLEEGEPGATVWRPIAKDMVNYVGEAVAVVLAEDVYSGQDGAELVEVEYDPLPVIIDPELALSEDSPKVHAHLADNVAFHSKFTTGDVRSAFKKAGQVVKLKLYNQRLSPAPMEPRGSIAEFDAGAGALTFRVSTQDPHGIRDELADTLSMSKESVRVIAPDVGGGFGGKAGMYPEDIVVAHAARTLRRPVKWVEGRRENLMTMKQGRGQVQFVEMAVRRDGRILGLKARIIIDAGAYSGPEIWLGKISLEMATGVYDIPAFQGEVSSVLTNKIPQGAYRGAGRPEASTLIERTINVVAARLKLDPVKVREINFIKKESFPFETAGGNVYDSGDYHANLKKALKVSDYDGLLAERRRAQLEGRLVGIGIATYVEVCAFGPGWPQTASMLVTDEGRVEVHAGGHSHGQGHVTTFTQIAADELGIAPDAITVKHGDTAMLPWSSLTAGSRSGALTGTAVLLCARKIKEKMSIIAANKLGTRSKMVFEQGRVYPEREPSKAVPFAEVAALAYDPEELPPGMEATLFAYTAFAPPGNAFPFGTQVAMVEVDRETGIARLLNYTAVDDCGRIINPLIVEGQVQGGIVQGIAQALLEEVVYDDAGQLLTSTFSDYLIPSADMFPNFVWSNTETPTPANPLGVKGVGEAGTIGSTPTIMNAVEDAMSEFGVTLEKMPASPSYLKSLMTKP